MPTLEATQVKCPECGARLQVAETATAARCQYCGAESRVQRRTQFFQLAQRMAAAAPHEPVRIARQVRTGRGILIGVIVAVCGVGVPLAIVGAIVAKSIGAGPFGGSTYWNGDAPTISDVDGDGVDDFIGFDRNVANDTMRLAAWSGVDGHAIWETPSLGNYSGVYQDGRFAAGGVVLVWDKLAHLDAFDAKTGATRWHASASEAIDGACALGDQVIIVTADKQRSALTLATGALAPAPAAEGCTVSTSPFHEATGATEVTFSHPTIAGMQVMNVFERGAGARIAVGSRSPGTAVPMIAALDATDKLLWKADVPGHDALAVQSPDLHVGVSDRDVAVAYSRGPRDHIEVTVFDRATGARRFETQLPTTTMNVLSAVTITRSAVAVSIWGSLQVFDVQTGKPRFAIGS